VTAGEWAKATGLVLVLALLQLTLVTPLEVANGHPDLPL
jgi:hypothetical protein